MEKKYLQIICKIMKTTLESNSLDLSEFTSDEDFFRIIKEQTFTPFLYYIDKNNHWRQFYYQAYLINEKFDKLAELLRLIFNNSNIDFIFLKGSILKQLYPLPFLRQMGDIDILVRNEDYDKAKEILLSNGFNYIDHIDYHTSFEKSGLNVELHNKLVSDNENYSSFLKKPFNNAININDREYIFDDTFNFIYLIQHYIKHLKSGAGLREICDLYLFIKNKNINIDLVRKTLQNENNLGFLDTLFTLIHYIFSYKKYDYEEIPDIEELIKYTLISGIHGFGQNNTRTKNEFVYSKKNKLAYLLKKWFIPPRKLNEIYPFTKFFLLLPIGYICRLFHLFSKRKKELDTVLNSTEEDDLLKRYGIN